MKIDKQLLSIILDIPLYAITDVILNDNNEILYSTYKLPTIKYESINIDTLNRLCKEWLKSEDCMLSVYYHIDTVVATVHINGARVYSSPSMTVYTELEAIIEAIMHIAKGRELI